MDNCGARGGAGAQPHFVFSSPTLRSVAVPTPVPMFGRQSDAHAPASDAAVALMLPPSTPIGHPSRSGATHARSKSRPPPLRLDEPAKRPQRQESDPTARSSGPTAWNPFKRAVRPPPGTLGAHYAQAAAGSKSQTNMFSGTQLPAFLRSPLSASSSPHSVVSWPGLASMRGLGLPGMARTASMGVPNPHAAAPGHPAASDVNGEQPASASAGAAGLGASMGVGARLALPRQWSLDSGAVGQSDEFPVPGLPAVQAATRSDSESAAIMLTGLQTVAISSPHPLAAAASVTAPGMSHLPATLPARSCGLSAPALASEPAAPGDPGEPSLPALPAAWAQAAHVVRSRVPGAAPTHQRAPSAPALLTALGSASFDGMPPPSAPGVAGTAASSTTEAGPAAPAHGELITVAATLGAPAPPARAALHLVSMAWHDMVGDAAMGTPVVPSSSGSIGPPPAPDRLPTRKRALSDHTAAFASPHTPLAAVPSLPSSNSPSGRPAKRPRGWSEVPVDSPCTPIAPPTPGCATHGEFATPHFLRLAQSLCRAAASVPASPALPPRASSLPPVPVAMQAAAASASPLLQLPPGRLQRHTSIPRPVAPRIMAAVGSPAGRPPPALCGAASVATPRCVAVLGGLLLPPASCTPSASLPEPCGNPRVALLHPGTNDWHDVGEARQLHSSLPPPATVAAGLAAAAGATSAVSAPEAAAGEAAAAEARWLAQQARAEPSFCGASALVSHAAAPGVLTFGGLCRRKAPVASDQTDVAATDCADDADGSAFVRLLAAAARGEQKQQAQPPQGPAYRRRSLLATEQWVVTDGLVVTHLHGAAQLHVTAANSGPGPLCAAASTCFVPPSAWAWPSVPPSAWPPSACASVAGESRSGSPVSSWLVVVGGFTGRRCSGAAHALDLASLRWHELGPLTDAHVLTPRCLAAAAFVPDAEALVVFGGLDGDAAALQDTLMLCRPRGEWLRVAQDGPAPAARAGHVAAAVGRFLLVHGGMGAGGVVLSDMWALDAVARAWARVEVTGDALPPRALHCACLIGYEGHLMLLCMHGARRAEEVLGALGVRASGEPHDRDRMLLFAEEAGAEWAEEQPDARGGAAAAALVARSGGMAGALEEDGPRSVWYVALALPPLPPSAAEMHGTGAASQ